ncbi:hypothetical protein F937_03530 [Acinetobacter calcoaceticus ANC 3680]|jgi:Flp pilus assembly CpaE family ATPase|uniref:hypothetical protein n=1 Tax=Acinetobacter calcoaceticus TaxID=471 RepID=UPI0002CE759A|nr:hypothetical protein F937_03530 [Acinetobacter calcoaceticus ANC 3680]
MFTNKTYIKFICASLFMLFMNGCANTKVNSDREALVNATRGAVNMVITDHRVYQKALASETSEVKKAMIYSTLEKADILRTFETEAGKDFVIEESLNTQKLNDLCWMAKFIRQSKNELPSKDQTIYSDIFTWVGKKEQSWLKKINDTYTKDELGSDDCRK